MFPTNQHSTINGSQLLGNRPVNTHHTNSRETLFYGVCAEELSWRKLRSSEGKTQAIYFSRRRRMPKEDLQLNGRNIPFLNSAKYLGVIFDRRLTWRLHIEKTLGTYITTYSIFQSKHLSANIKLIVYRALIRSIMIYACPTWEFAADAHLMKLQRLQNRILRAIWQ
jgi:hypothetical protein